MGSYWKVESLSPTGLITAVTGRVTWWVQPRKRFLTFCAGISHFFDEYRWNDTNFSNFDQMPASFSYFQFETISEIFGLSTKNTYFPQKLLRIAGISLELTEDVSFHPIFSKLSQKPCPQAVIQPETGTRKLIRWRSSHRDSEKRMNTEQLWIGQKFRYTLMSFISVCRFKKFDRMFSESTNFVIRFLIRTLNRKIPLFVFLVLGAF